MFTPRFDEPRAVRAAPNALNTALTLLLALGLGACTSADDGVASPEATTSDAAHGSTAATTLQTTTSNAHTASTAAPSTTTESAALSSSPHTTETATADEPSSRETSETSTIDERTELAGTSAPVSVTTSTSASDAQPTSPNVEDDAGAGSVTSSNETTPTNAANVCNETVPDDRQVDGIPAYAQCSDSESVGIWSNDGINTTTTQQSDWRRTQWGGGYQCTEFANRYLYFVWGVERVPNGDAGTWCDEEPPEGLVQAPSPVHGDLIVFAPGSCGASPDTGHVAVVDTVDEPNARVVIVEQNRAGRRQTEIECAACFLHAIANDAL